MTRNSKGCLPARCKARELVAQNHFSFIYIYCFILICKHEETGERREFSPSEAAVVLCHGVACCAGAAWLRNYAGGPGTYRRQGAAMAGDTLWHDQAPHG